LLKNTGKDQYFWIHKLYSGYYLKKDKRDDKYFAHLRIRNYHGPNAIGEGSFEGNKVKMQLSSIDKK